MWLPRTEDLSRASHDAEKNSGLDSGGGGDPSTLCAELPTTPDIYDDEEAANRRAVLTHDSEGNYPEEATPDTSSRESWENVSEVVNFLLLSTAATLSEGANASLTKPEELDEKGSAKFLEGIADVIGHIGIGRACEATYNILVESLRLDVPCSQKIWAVECVVFAHFILSTLSNCNEPNGKTDSDNQDDHWEIFVSVAFLAKMSQVTDTYKPVLKALSQTFFLSSRISDPHYQMLLNANLFRRGFAQHMFEIFAITLALNRKWNYIFTLFRRMSPVADYALRNFDQLIFSEDKDEFDDFLRFDIAGSDHNKTAVEGMKFPWVVFVQLLWEIERRPNIKPRIIRILLFFALSKGVSDNLFVNRKWHRKLMLHKKVVTLEGVTCPHRLSELLSAEFREEDRSEYFTNLPLADDLDIFICTYVLRDSDSEGVWILPMGETGPSDIFSRESPLDEMTQKQKTQVRVLWKQLSNHLKALEKFYSLLELLSRICENSFICDDNSPADELEELLSNSDSIEDAELMRMRRIVSAITGCILSPMELHLLSILEAYDRQFGIASGLPGFKDTKPRKFRQALNVSDFIITCFMDPILRGQIPTSGDVCIVRQQEQHYAAEKSHKMFPTQLSDELVTLLPAWFATQGNQIALSSRFKTPRLYLSWRALCLELMVCASKNIEREPGVIAPHLDDELLYGFVQLYVDVGNPRALHFLSRCFNLPDASGVTKTRNYDQVQKLLTRAGNSNFIAFVDAIADWAVTDCSANMTEISEHVVKIYIESSDISSAARFVQRVPNPKTKSYLEGRFEPVLHSFEEEDSSPASPATWEESDSPTSPLNSNLGPPRPKPNVRTRWKPAGQTLDGIEHSPDPGKAAEKVFHELRNRPGGLPDISLANKLLHICVSKGRMNEALRIFDVLQKDWRGRNGRNHSTHGRRLKPDVVTFNVILKGLSREKPIPLETIAQFVVDMENGDFDVTPDKVTYNTIINAAVIGGSFERAWAWYREMKRKNVVVDGYTCSILMKQVGPSSPPEVISEILQLLSELDPVDDPVLLSSMVDVYSRLKDFKRLLLVLKAYEGRMENPPTYALATMVRGYAKCGKINQAYSIWEKVDETIKQERLTSWRGGKPHGHGPAPDEAFSSSHISGYILGCGIDAFLTLGDVDKALEIFSLSMKTETYISEVQGSLLIRACTYRKRLNDALTTYESLVAIGMEPCEVTYNNLMHTCVSNGDLDRAMLLLRDMLATEKHKPDIVTYSTILKGMCNKGQLEAAKTLFSDLIRHGIHPDIVTYNTLLEGFSKADEMQDFENLVREIMGESKLKATCYTLTILVNFYGRNHRIDKVFEYVESLPTLFGFELDAFAYTAIIAACTWNGLVKEALDYLNVLRKLFSASARIYGTVISGCMKLQMWTHLEIVLRYVSEDQVRLGKRDLSSLADLLKGWKSRTMNVKWRRSGFNEKAAQTLSIFLNSKKINSPNVMDLPVEETA